MKLFHEVQQSAQHSIGLSEGGYLEVLFRGVQPGEPRLARRKAWPEHLRRTAARKNFIARNLCQMDYIAIGQKLYLDMPVKVIWSGFL